MNLFKLAATLGLDKSDYDKGLDDAKSKASSVGGGIASALGTAVKVGAAAMTAATAAAGGAILKVTKDSLTAYADYEQLVGGIQKLYGNMGMSIEDYAASVGQTVDQARDKYNQLETAQNLVMENARNAYQTSGMSMNQYMETATSFSAALINSLGGDTVAAAEQTDVAMRAISDNFNTFGGDIEMVKNAYQGFARENYMMLDNLKLGYAGNKEGMQELIADANEYAKSIGMAGDLSIESFADVVTAIDLVQQKQGIAGTTAREAATTIAGSFGMLSAAWQNLVTGMADSDANMEQLIENVVSSAETAFNNVLPVVEQALSGIGTLIERLAPVIGEKLPTIITSVAPKLLTAATSLVVAIGKGISSSAGQLVTAATDIIKMLMDGLAQASPNLIPTIIDVVLFIVDTLVENVGMFIDAAVALILGLADGLVEALPNLIERIPEIVMAIVEAIVENAPTLLEAAATLIMGLADGIIASLPVAVGAITSLVGQLGSYLIERAPEFLSHGAQIITSLASGLLSAVGEVISIMEQIVSDAANQISTFDWVGKGTELITKIVSGVASFFSKLPDKIREISENAAAKIEEIDWEEAGRSVIRMIIDGIQFLFVDIPNKLREIGNNAFNEMANVDWLQLGKDIVNGIVNGIKNVGSAIGNAIVGFVKGAKDEAKVAIESNSPSKLFAREVGMPISQGIAMGIEDELPLIQNAMDRMNGLFENNVHPTVDIKTTTSQSNSASGEDKIDTVISLMRSMLENGLGVSVELDYDADGVFRIVRDQNRQYIKRTGMSAFEVGMA